MAQDDKKPDSSTVGCSARLNILLDAAEFPPEGSGRGAEFAKRFGVSKANASRWLKSDTLPRDYNDLDRIARALGSSASWWAYGDPTSDAAPDFMLVGRCVNAILLYLDQHGGAPLSIDDDILVAAYSEVYEQAHNNDGVIDPAAVASAATRALGSQHRRHSKN